MTGNRKLSLLTAGLLISLSLSLTAPGASAAGKRSRADDPGCPGCLTSAAGLFARGNTLEAADLLRAWKDKCPGNLQLRLLLNTVLMRLPSAREEALQVAQEATALAPDSSLAHFQCAMTLLTMGRSQQAAASFEQVVAIDPANYEAWLSLADLYGSLGETERSRTAQAKAASLSPTTRSARTRTITSLNRAGNIKGVKAEVKRLFNENLEAEFFLGLADELLNIGYFNEAAQCLNHYLEQDQSHTSAAAKIKFNLALCRYLSGNSSSNGGAFLAASSEEARALSGLLAMDQGDLGTARKIIVPHSNNSLMQMAAGKLAGRDGDYKTARQYFNSAARDPRLSICKLKLAELALKNDDPMEAISSAAELSKVSGLKVRALALQIRGRLRQCESNKDIELDKDTLQSLVQELSRTLTESSESEQGAPQDKNNLACAYSALALAAMGSDSSRAQTDIERALALDKYSPDVLIASAKINEKVGRPQQAKAALEAALALAPGDIEALSSLGQILSKEGDSRGATLLEQAKKIKAQ